MAKKEASLTSYRLFIYLLVFILAGSIFVSGSTIGVFSPSGRLAAQFAIADIDPDSSVSFPEIERNYCNEEGGWLVKLYDSTIERWVKIISSYDVDWGSEEFCRQECIGHAAQYSSIVNYCCGSADSIGKVLLGIDGEEYYCSGSSYDWRGAEESAGEIFYNSIGWSEATTDGEYWYQCDAKGDGPTNMGGIGLDNGDIIDTQTEYGPQHSYICYKSQDNKERVAECCGDRDSDCISSGGQNGGAWKITGEPLAVYNLTPPSQPVTYPETVFMFNWTIFDDDGDEIDAGSNNLTFFSTPKNIGGFSAPQQLPMVAYYKFEDNFQDSAGANHGTNYQNKTTFISGKVGKAAHFSNEAHAVLPSSSAWGIGNQFSIELWVKFDTLSGGAKVFWSRQYAQPNNHAYIALRYNDKRLQFIGSTSYNQPTYYSAAWAPDTNVWHHIAMVKNSDEYEAFVDGQSLGKQIKSEPHVSYDGNAYIGCIIDSGYNPQQEMKGDIDELMIYQTALTQQEAQQHYLGAYQDGLSGAENSTNYTISSSSNLVNLTFSDTKQQHTTSKYASIIAALTGQACTPNCMGKECGNDGCGGSCGECPGGLYCSNNACQAADPLTYTLFYCTHGYDWVSDLDDSDSITCNAAQDAFGFNAGYRWTGTKCCGDDGAADIYNDERACFRGRVVSSCSGLVNNNMTLSEDGILYFCDSSNYCDVRCDDAFFCSVQGGKWAESYGSSRGNLTMWPVDGSSECCEAGDCWNGIECMENQANADFLAPYQGYICINSAWKIARPKTTPWGESGYCSEESQCLLSPIGNFSQNGRPELDPQCLFNGQFKGDHYCENGQWTSRTKLIALQLLDYANRGEMLNYTLFCDSYDKILNYFGYTTGISLQLAESFIKDSNNNRRASNFCVLNGNDIVIFGVPLNYQPNSNDNLPFLYALEKNRDYCGRAFDSDDQFDHCGVFNTDVWYNNRTQSIIYSNEDIILRNDGEALNFWDAFLTYIKSKTDTIINWIKGSSFHNPSFPPAYAEWAYDYSFVNKTRRFDRLYVSQCGSKSIMGLYEAPNLDSKQYASVKYTGFENDVCDLINSYDNPNYNLIVCEKTGDDSYVVSQKIAIAYVFPLIFDPDRVWNDLTAKLRPELCA